VPHRGIVKKRETQPTSTSRRETCREAEAIPRRTDRGGLEAGGSRCATWRADPEGGIPEQAFCRWKKQYVGLRVGQIRQLKQLQEENGRLKRLVAELPLEKQVLRDVAQGNFSAPSGVIVR
jgi:putative transposase